MHRCSRSQAVVGRLGLAATAPRGGKHGGDSDVRRLGSYYNRLRVAVEEPGTTLRLAELKT